MGFQRLSVSCGAINNYLIFNVYSKTYIKIRYYRQAKVPRRSCFHDVDSFSIDSFFEIHTLGTSFISFSSAVADMVSSAPILIGFCGTKGSSNSEAMQNTWADILAPEGNWILMKLFFEQLNFQGKLLRGKAIGQTGTLTA